MSTVRKDLVMEEKDKISCMKLLTLSDIGLGLTKMMYALSFGCAIANAMGWGSSLWAVVGKTVFGLATIPLVTYIGSKEIAYAKYGKKYSYEAVDVLKKVLEVQHKREELNNDLKEIENEYSINLEDKKTKHTFNKKDELEAKEKYINGVSKRLREAREEAVSKAEKEGKPLAAKEVIELRNREEKKRLQANKNIMALKHKKER